MGAPPTLFSSKFCTSPEVVQNFELKRVGGAAKGHQLAPLQITLSRLMGRNAASIRKIKTIIISSAKY